jgi:ribosome biogenesis protein SSF1/2
MNGFGNREENDPLKLASLMLQSMFPPIKVAQMNLSACKRVVLFNIKDGKDKEDAEEEAETPIQNPTIEFRHYGVSARQRAVNRGIKKLVNNQRVPNLAKYESLVDFILKNKRVGKSADETGSTNNDSFYGNAYSSESEIEDLPGSKVVLPDDYMNHKKDSSVAIRLHEIGPRMSLKLVKIEEGLCRGNVVFHAH